MYLLLNCVIKSVNRFLWILFQLYSVESVLFCFVLFCWLFCSIWFISTPLFPVPFSPALFFSIMFQLLIHAEVLLVQHSPSLLKKRTHRSRPNDVHLRKKNICKNLNLTKSWIRHCLLFLVLLFLCLPWFIGCCELSYEDWTGNGSVLEESLVDEVCKAHRCLKET